jgi:hypothetical protein
MKICSVLSFFLLACLVVSAGCAADTGSSRSRRSPPSYVPSAAGNGASDPTQVLVLGVWLQDDPDLSPTLAVDGCDFWQDAVTTIACMSAPRDEAHIRIYANTQLCPPAFDAMGVQNGWILATAYGGETPYRVGTVVVNTDCLWRPFGPRTAPSAEQFRVMVAHEIGHVLGLWEHVPRDCTDAMGKLLPGVPIHPSGAPICGPAIMNPSVDVALSRLTGPDILQFDRRSIDISVLPVPPMADMAALGTPTCTVLAPL